MSEVQPNLRSVLDTLTRERLFDLRRVTGAGLRPSRESNTGWIEFFVTGLETPLQEVRAKGEQAIRADVIATAKRLNQRQASLVAAFLERTSLSLADCEAVLPNVARRTVQRDLKHLIDAGLIGEVGQGPTDPTRRYRWLGAEL